ncbi:lipid asymmetry maintenance protein MlaB [Psychrobium sp. 1_MG-2023]|uniref:STAS domain-containing protein n=1 Tax=Psychrobium sp. 1_MG-2023 TaxID=3062624 RepID=UPI000C329489|nr:STAS domain-containing protein [Psychrobium sp. 1_MG-2023]MDP2560145.1 STAS domain-containing protein [Psychrobium sp. 1_MG-2023]PKF56958.1 hypothetical protein CW748_07630 [Alteromonadales bacterium alter-6D02]
MDANTLSLPQSIDISYVTEFHPQLISFLSEFTESKNDILVINASELERIDTAGIQLLIAFVIEATKMNVTIQWQSISTELENTANELGLAQALKLN